MSFGPVHCLRPFVELFCVIERLFGGYFGVSTVSFM